MIHSFMTKTIIQRERERECSSSQIRYMSESLWIQPGTVKKLIMQTQKYRTPPPHTQLSHPSLSSSPAFLLLSALHLHCLQLHCIHGACTRPNSTSFRNRIKLLTRLLRTFLDLAHLMWKDITTVA